MSIDVPAGLLAAETAKYDFAYLLTVSKESAARLVAVTFSVRPDGTIDLPDVGNSALTNVAIRKQATVLFPPSGRADHSLIVDGGATADLATGSVTVTPARSTLHRPAPPRAATAVGGSGHSRSGDSGAPTGPAFDAPPPAGLPAAGSAAPSPVTPNPVTPNPVTPNPATPNPAPQHVAPSSTGPQPAAGGSVEDRLAAMRNRAEQADLAQVEKSTLEHMAELTGKGLTSRYDLNQAQYTEVTSAPGANTTAKSWDYPVRPGQVAPAPPGGPGRPAASGPSQSGGAATGGEARPDIVDADIVDIEGDEEPGAGGPGTAGPG